MMKLSSFLQDLHRTYERVRRENSIRMDSNKIEHQTVKSGKKHKYLSNWNLRRYREQSKKVPWEVSSGQAIVRCLKQSVKGVQSNENKYCVWYRNGSLGRWLAHYIRSQALGITLATGCIGESGFDPVELWVMGPPCGLKVESGLTSCTVAIARHAREYPVSYVSNNIGTKGEGRREPSSCSLNEADQ